MKRMTKKALPLVLSASMLCGMYTPTVMAAEYSDTKGHWAEKAIERWGGYGIVGGYGDGLFKPDGTITRAEMAVVLSKTLGLTETKGNPFNDVKDNDWFATHILRCYAAGILSGSDGMANPNAQITRQEAMSMLARALEIAPADVSKLAGYPDNGSVASWAAPHVAALVSGGIVGGMDDGTLAPAGAMSRAALMTVLNRAVVQYIQADGTYELTDADGIILVAAKNVTLTGETDADILVTSVVEAVAFDNAVVNGSISVQNEDTAITAKDSTLPEISGIEVEEETVKEEVKEEPKKPSGGGGGGGGSHRPSTPSYADFTITQDGETVENATYQDVTVSASVGDGDVTLKNMNILGDLTINGGGSYSVVLIDCNIGGKIIMNKVSGEVPRLELTGTPVKEVVAEQPAIIEATDTVSTVTKVLAEASVTVDSQVVEKVEVPATAANVVVDVKGNAAIEVETDAADTIISADDATNITVTGEKKDDVAAVHTHAWGQGAVTTEPSCTTEGVKTFTCEAADCPVGTKTEPIAKTEHTPVVDEAVPADCEGSGKKEGSHCSVCNTVIVAQEEIPALGHDFTSEASTWVNTDPSYHWKKCVRCGADDTVEVPHVYEATNCTEAAVCTVCAYEKAAGQHTFGEWVIVKEATCTESGEETRTCSSCGEEEKEYPIAMGHSFATEFIVDKEATCGEDGSKSKHCAGCDEKTEVTAIPATGEHSYGAWAKADDTDHSKACSVCDDVVTEAHSWDEGVVTTEPTETEAGVKTFTCVTCAGTMTESVPATGSEAETQTIALTEYKDGKVEVEWSGYALNGNNCWVFKIVGENGEIGSGYKSEYISTNEGENRTYDLATYLPKVEVDQSVTCDFILYEEVMNDDGTTTGTYTERARLDDCIIVTGAGDAVAYDLAYDAEAQKYSITLEESPSGVKYVGYWTVAKNGRYNPCVFDLDDFTDNVATQTKTDVVEGDTFELRNVTTYSLSDGVLSATMTPASEKTYTVSETTANETE